MNLLICEQACQAPPSNRTQSSANFRSDILLRALLADIALMEDVQVTVVHDRANALHDLPKQHGVPRVVSLDKTDTGTTIDQCIDDADVVWPLAPESNGLLEAISKDVQRHDKILLGCTPDAIRLSGSKYLTSQALRAADIAVVPTYRTHSTLPTSAGAWVVKPDDGAGCSDTHIFPTLRAAREWIMSRVFSNYVLQPYLPGRPCSLSLLCGAESVFLLGCNDQHIAVSDNQFHYMGSTVNGMDDPHGQLAQLARRVIAAIPGIWGYVGIDLIMTEHGPVVLEVNPRITMSHGGLHASIGVNPAKMLFDVLRLGYCDVRPCHQHRQISVDIHGAHPGSASTLN